MELKPTGHTFPAIISQKMCVNIRVAKQEVENEILQWKVDVDNFERIRNMSRKIQEFL